MELYSLDIKCDADDCKNNGEDMNMIEILIDRHSRKCRMVFECYECRNKEEYECNVGYGDHDPYLTLL